MKKVIALCLLCSILCADPIYKSKDYSNLYKMEGFTKSMLELHFKLYQGYVQTTNTLNEKLEELSKNGGDRTLEYAGFKRMYGWEYDGMRLHEYYFENLGGNGKLDSKTALYRKIIHDYGSFDKWKQDFIATGMMRGIGWSILYFDKKSGKLTNAWINEHDLGHLAGNTTILVMDVFEHAYITHYGIDRAAYIKAFFKNIDWDMCATRFKDAN